MSRVIYVDVLLSVNFLLDWFLLRLSGKLSEIRVSKILYCLGALVGAAISLVILLPSLGRLFSIAVSLLSAAVMCLTTFWGRGTKAVMRAFLWLYLLSACYAGIMLAIWLLICPDGMEVNNGFVYINVTPELIILCAVSVYLIISLLGRYGIIKNKNVPHCIVQIEHRGKRLTLDGIVDTGNLLTEPISGLPVIVGADTVLRQVVPPEIASFTKGDTALNGEKIRIVPYRTIGGEGIGAAFLPERITIEYNGSKADRSAYILPIDNFNTASDCSVIVGARLVDIN